MTKKLNIEDIAFYRNAEGDVRGEIDFRLNGIYYSESFAIYASYNWEFKGWSYSRLLSKAQKKALETAILAKVA